MKILFISTDYPDVNKNTNMYTDLTLELKEAGHEVTVAVCEEKKNILKTYMSKEAGIDVLRVRIGDLYNIGFVKKTMTFLTLPFFMIKGIKKNIKDREFDFILFQVPPVTLYSVISWAMKKFNCPSFLMMKDIFPQNAVDINVMQKKSLIYKVFRYMEKRLYKITSNIGCMSEKNIECILEHNKYLNKDKMSIFPNTKRADFTENNLDKDRIKEKFKINKDKILAMFGGNLGPAQGIDFFKEVLFRYKDRKDLSFVIASRGVRKQEVLDYIKKNNIENVYSFDFLPREEFEDLLSVCDIGLIFLDSRFTIPNIPSKTISYMEQGIPIMAAVDRYTDYDKLINESKCGICSYSDDIEGFVKQFDSMIENDELREQMKKNGREYFKEYLTTTTSIKLLGDFYDSIVKEKIEKEKSKKKKVMFICSVGGHLTQMLELKPLFKEYEYVLVTEKTDVTVDMKNKYNMEYMVYCSRQYIGTYFFKEAYNIVKSMYLFFKYKPDVVITTGTHTAVPMMFLAKVFKKKGVFIESFAKRISPTLSGKYVYKHKMYSTFVVQWESMLKVYPKAEYWGTTY